MISRRSGPVVKAQSMKATRAASRRAVIMVLVIGKGYAYIL